MANGLEAIFQGAGKAPIELTQEQKQRLYSSIGYSPGQTLTGKQVKQAQKVTKKGKIGIAGSYQDILASALPASAFESLPSKIGNQFTKAGYTRFGDSLIKPVTAQQLTQAGRSGYAEEDVRDYLAGQFAGGQLQEEIRRFMAPSYKLDPKTGKYIKPSSIPVGKEKESTGQTTGPAVTSAKSILEGLNPEFFPGSTPAEIEYATQIDPYKIQAKSSQKIAQIGQGTSLYNLIGYARP
jgi:hypothetical protein